MTELSSELSDFLSPGHAYWHDFLPNPHGYYAARVPKFAHAPRRVPWGVGLCPFHGNDNTDILLMVDLMHGTWHCSSTCGSGDVVEFHMRMYGASFDNAVRELILLREGQK
jgi:hypothetical protein